MWWSLLWSVALATAVVGKDKPSTSCPDHSVGLVMREGVEAKCEFEPHVEHYFFLIRWPEAPYVPDVLGHLLYFRYDNGSESKTWCDRSLWNDPVTTQIELHNGFKLGHKLFFAVVARTTPENLVPRTENTVNNFQVNLTNAGACPVESHIQPLPNDKIVEGDTYSFRCVFEGDEPTPPPLISWLFSPDRRDCDTKVQPIDRRNKSGFYLSQDRRTVTVLRANQRHAGCYKLTVQYPRNKYFHQKGYLSVSKNHDNHKKGGVSILAETISLILGGVVLVGFAVAAAMRISCVRRGLTKKVTETEESVKRVYVCHTMDDNGGEEEHELTKFLSILRSFNVDLTVDVVSRRLRDMYSVKCVEESMAMADKVLVLLTPSFIEALEDCQECGDATRPVCRPHAELKVVTGMMFKPVEQVDRQLLILSKGVKQRNFPAVIAMRPYLSFPLRLITNPDEDLDEDIRRILCALLEREPKKALRPDYGYHNI